jgi:hypothetical protein
VDIFFRNSPLERGGLPPLSAVATGQVNSESAIELAHSKA